MISSHGKAFENRGNEAIEGVIVFIRATVSPIYESYFSRLAGRICRPTKGLRRFKIAVAAKLGRRLRQKFEDLFECVDPSTP